MPSIYDMPLCIFLHKELDRHHITILTESELQIVVLPFEHRQVNILRHTFAKHITLHLISTDTRNDGSTARNYGEICHTIVF